MNYLNTNRSILKLLLRLNIIIIVRYIATSLRNKFDLASDEKASGTEIKFNFYILYLYTLFLIIQ